jgi:hypothetical protein
LALASAGFSAECTGRFSRAAWAEGGLLGSWSGADRGCLRRPVLIFTERPKILIVPSLALRPVASAIAVAASRKACIHSTIKKSGGVFARDVHLLLLLGAASGADEDSSFASAIPGRFDVTKIQ